MVNLHAVFIVVSEGESNFYFTCRLLFCATEQEADVKCRDSLGFFGKVFYCRMVFYKLIACDAYDLQFSAVFEGALGVFNGYLRGVVGLGDHLVACYGIGGKGVGGVGDKVAFHLRFHFVGSRLQLIVVVFVSKGLV